MTTPTHKKKPRRRAAAPKPPSKPRVAVRAPRVAAAEAMATLGNKLVASAEANPSVFVNPPTIPPLKTALGTLATSIIAAEGGTDAAQTTLLTASGKVRDLVVQHGAWIQAGANNLAPSDAVSFITLAGFDVAKMPHRTAVTSPEVTNGPPTTVHFDLPNVSGAVMWFTEVSLDGGKTFTRSVDTERRKGDITGLPSGQSVTVRLRAFVRGSGYTPWTTLTIVVT
jgi:hypothetical protein